MMIHCDGFRVSDLVFGGECTWQNLTCYVDGKAICLLHVMGVKGRVNPASVGKVGKDGVYFSNVCLHAHHVGSWRVEHHPSDDGLTEVYDLIAEGKLQYQAFATVFVPRTGDMPDVVRQEQEAALSV
jgi:hypothetical protein